MKFLKNFFSVITFFLFIFDHNFRKGVIIIISSSSITLFVKSLVTFINYLLICV